MLSYYVERRQFEWAMTAPMLVTATLMLIWPKMLGDSAFKEMLTVMPETFVASCLFAIGWLGLIGLLLNGHSLRGYRLGPMLRAIAAAGRAVMWSQFAWALLRLSFEQGFPSPGVPFWTMFVLMEIRVARRAMAGNDERNH